MDKHVNVRTVPVELRSCIEVLEFRSHINTSNVADPPGPGITQMLSWTVFEPEPLVGARDEETHPRDSQALDYEAINRCLLAIIRAAQTKAPSQLRLDSNSEAPSILDILFDEIENIGSQDVENKTDEVIRLVVTAATESKKAAILSMEAATKSATASKETAEASKHTVEASIRAADAATQSAIASKETAEASKYTAEAAKDSREASTQNTKETQVQGAKLTVFTVITTVFTPLNFLTSYLGMNLNDMRSTTWTQQQFWALTAPITLAILVFVLVVAFKYQWVARLFTWISQQFPTRTRFVPTHEASSSTSTPHRGFTAAEEGVRDLADVEAQSTRVIWSQRWPWKLLR